MKHLLLVSVLAIILLVSGCADVLPPKPGEDNQNVVPPPQNGSGADNSAQGDGSVQNGASGARGPDGYVIPEGSQTESPITEQERVPSPIDCGHTVIQREVVLAIGSDYMITKSAPGFGSPFDIGNCFVKKDNVSIITFKITEMPNQQNATDALEDEKNQYRQQLFNYSVSDSEIGSKGYLFEQPVKNGSLYRLIFVDDSRPNILVVVKSSSPIEKGVVLKLGEILEKLI